MINKRNRKFEIAKEIEKSPSTIAREINKHRQLKSCNYFNENNYNCKVCTGKCKIYLPISCPDRDRNIGACNNCIKYRSCKLDKYFYKAEVAEKNYQYTLKDSRQGVNLNTSELFEIAHIICPLIKKRTIYLYDFKKSS